MQKSLTTVGLELHLVAVLINFLGEYLVLGIIARALKHKPK